MDMIYRYILCVICTAILSGIICGVFPKKENTHIRFVAGLAVTISVLTLLFNGRTFDLESYFDQFTVDTTFATSEGEEMARQTSATFIKEKTESYVLNKAAELGTDLDVSIVLSNEEFPVPKEITVFGSVSPYVKKQLITTIEENLGIDEDAQLWIS